MLNEKDLIRIAETIREDYPNESQDFVDAFEWLSLAIDGVLTSIGNQLKEIHNSNDYSKIIVLANFSVELKDLQKQIINVSSYFENLDDDSDLVEDDNIEEERKFKINYEDYSVDSRIPHTLFEDYKHTKACAFSLFENVYEAKNMRDVLLQTCSLLAEMDIEKLKSFINDPSMKGRTVSYFNIKPVVEEYTNKNEKIPGTDIYVWVNLSCNHIRNILRKMLKKYGINFNDYKIFLRADYSELHKSEKEDDVKVESVDKIGKYVKGCMRKLSDNSYRFTENEMIAMQSLQWCKKHFHIYEPLIKKYNNTKDISTQIYTNNFPRYWKEIFIFNGDEYLVTSQWYERNRSAFDKWFNELNLGENK